MRKEIEKKKEEIEKEERINSKISSQFKAQLENNDLIRSELEDLLDRKESIIKIVRLLENDVEKSKLMENLALYKGKDIESIRKTQREIKMDKGLTEKKLEEKRLQLKAIDSFVEQQNKCLSDGVAC